MVKSKYSNCIEHRFVTYASNMELSSTSLPLNVLKEMLDP